MREAGSANGDAGADGVAVGFRTDGLDAQHVVGVGVVVAKKACGAVRGGEEEVEVAVAIEVEVGCAAADDGLAEGGAELVGDVFELATAAVTKQQRGLGVLDGRLDDRDVVGDVAVDGEDIGEAVEIVVEEEGAEGERGGGGGPDAGGCGAVGEEAGAIVVIERDALVGEVADDEPGAAGAVTLALKPQAPLYGSYDVSSRLV